MDKILVFGDSRLSERFDKELTKSKGTLFTNGEVKKYDHIIYAISSNNDVPVLQFFDELLQSNFADTLVDAVHPNDIGHEILFTKIKDFLGSRLL